MWMEQIVINLERRRKILDILEKEGQILTIELENRLGVTGATIRSDLREMDREGAVVRFHGGATLADQSSLISPNENYLKRSIMNVDEKRQIGREAAKLVNNGETIFLDASSTSLHMVPFIRHLDNVTIVTNGINTALEIQRFSNFKTIMIGGVLRSHSGTIEGILCEDMLSKISGDTYFVSGNGFSVEAGLTGNNFYELELKRICAQRCGKIVALVDSSKLNNNSTSSFILSNQIDLLITDRGISKEQLRIITETGMQVIIAETE